MRELLHGLPRPIRIPLAALIAIGSALMGVLFEQPVWVEFGFLVVFALALWVLAASIWHFTNRWRELRGKPRLVFDANYIIAFLLLAAAAVFFFQAGKPSIQASQVSDLQAKIATLQASIDKYVRPREFTEEQAKRLEDFLLKYGKSKIEVVYMPSNQEAAEYASRIFNAFRQAEWDASIKAAPHDRTLNEGLEIKVEYAPDAPANPTLADLISRALREAGVDVRGSGSGRHQGVTETKAYIIVGHRPRR